MSSRRRADLSGTDQRSLVVPIRSRSVALPRAALSPVPAAASVAQREPRAAMNGATSHCRRISHRRHEKKGTTSMNGSHWIRKRRCKRPKEPADPWETAGPHREWTPMAPPSPNPNPHQEEREHEGSQPIPSRRWASALLSVRYGIALLSMTWVLVPPDLRDLLVNAVSR